MYLTETEVQRLLNAPIFTEPVTQSINTYQLYQGRLSTTVVTVRFNMTADSFSADFMINYLNSRLPTFFSPPTRLLVCVTWDLLLIGPGGTYYIFKANSNRVHNDESFETVMNLTYVNIARLCHNYSRMHVNDLNVKFDSSNVKIAKILSIVTSFMKM